MMVGVGIVIVVLAYAALAIYLTIVYHRNPCERTAPTQLSPGPVFGVIPERGGLRLGSCASLSLFSIDAARDALCPQR